MPETITHLHPECDCTHKPGFPCDVTCPVHGMPNPYLFCPQCGNVNAAELGPVTGLCLDGRACRRRQAGLEPVNPSGCECFGLETCERCYVRPATVPPPTGAKSLHDLPIFGWAWVEGQ